MYEITYKKQASKDLETIKRDKSLYKDFLMIEKALEENPFYPNLPQSRIPKNGIKMKNTKIDTYHVKLTSRDRVFYRIDEYNKTIIIDNIEYEGNVKILQLLGHDL